MKSQEQKFYHRITSTINQLLDQEFKCQDNKSLKTTPTQWLEKQLKKDFKAKRPQFDNSIQITDIKNFYQKAISQQKYHMHISSKQQDNLTPNSLILKIINKSIKNKTIKLHELSRNNMMLIESILKPGQQKYQNILVSSNNIEQLRQIISVEQYLFKLQISALKRYQKLLQKQKFFKFWCQKVREVQLFNRSEAMKITILETHTKSKRQITKYKSQIQQMILQNTSLQQNIIYLKKIFQQKYQDLEELNNNNNTLEIECESFQKIQQHVLIDDQLEIRIFESNFEKDLKQKLEKIRIQNINAHMIQNITKVQYQINTIRQNKKLLQKQREHLKLQIKDLALISSFKTLKDNHNSISQKLKYAISKLNQSKTRYLKLLDKVKKCQTKVNNGVHQYFLDWRNKIEQLKQGIHSIQQRQRNINKMQDDLKALNSISNSLSNKIKRVPFQKHGCKQQVSQLQKQTVIARISHQ